MSDTTKAILGALIRHGLSIVGTFVGGEGFLTGDDTNLVAGTFVAFASACWSIYEKYRRAKTP